MSSGAVCVYCAASLGNSPTYRYAAQSLGEALAKGSRPLIYGGGKIGLMGIVSQAVLDNEGYVTGVSPVAMVSAGGELSKVGEDKVTNRAPPLHKNRTDIVVDNMHERKMEMAKRAPGGFVALPGGFGTLEELLEVTTWSQLAIHIKPILIINVKNYFSPLREQIRKGIEAGFIREENFQLVSFIDGPEDESLHDSFDWGGAAVEALDSWKPSGWKGFGFDWSKKKDGRASPLNAI